MVFVLLRDSEERINESEIRHKMKKFEENRFGWKVSVCFFFGNIHATTWTCGRRLVKKIYSPGHVDIMVTILVEEKASPKEEEAIGIRYSGARFDDPVNHEKRLLCACHFSRKHPKMQICLAWTKAWLKPTRRQPLTPVTVEMTCNRLTEITLGATALHVTRTNDPETNKIQGWSERH